MDNNDLYPNDGRYFTLHKPQALQDAEDKSTADTFAEFPLLKEVIKHLDGQIVFLDSIDSVKADVKDYQALVNQIAANKLAKAKLTQERNFIELRVKSAKKRSIAMSQPK